MLGYANREELLQVDIPTQVYLHPGRRQRIEQELKLQGAVKNYEETLQRKDGSLIHVLINSFAVTDALGTILQYRGLMLDVTGLKTSQTELQRERDFSDKILNNTQSLILVVDSAGLISYANRRWSDLGFTQKQLLDRPLLDLVARPPGVFVLPRQALGEVGSDEAGAAGDERLLPIRRRAHPRAR